MSTNFYFKVKTDININIPTGGNIKETVLNKINIVLKDITKLHIGKKSNGWCPLFEATEYYSSVKEIKNFYLANQDYLNIIDEYDKLYTLDELEEELFNHNNNNILAKSHLNIAPNFYFDKEGYEFARHCFS